MNPLESWIDTETKKSLKGERPSADRILAFVDGLRAGRAEIEALTARVVKLERKARNDRLHGRS